MNVPLSRKLLLVGLGLAVVALLRPIVAAADSTLHIGPGTGTTCAQGCAGDPNLIGSGDIIDIFQTSGGSGSALTGPQVLILGVPNDTTNLFASNPVTGVNYINPYPGGTSTAGSSPNFTFASDMTSGDVYGFLGLAGTNASNSFTNWAAADASVNGIVASNFGIYELSLNGASLGPKGLINILFASGSLPLGTFAVAYGTDAAGKAFDTPFTEAGLTASTSTTPTPTGTVPEPGTLLLVGTGLLAGAAGLKRRTKLPQF